ncbi:hypothetical protein SAY86_001902 [Trapa natans]|uniref:RRM domain-containing protein n=1 Tax=Trapa natans TaxID=22666 RepID=A0AAN7LNB3_TRANT|nr:hypothetical protein SAY86_001902 [Trapa natans]
MNLYPKHVLFLQGLIDSVSFFPADVQIFEAFGLVELVQLPLDPETGHCKGFGFVQFSQLEHAKAAPSVNEKLKIADRFHKISFVTDHIGAQDTAAKSMDLDDDEGGLALNAQSQEMLMEKLDRTGTATSIVGVSWSTCT